MDKTQSAIAKAQPQIPNLRKRATKREAKTKPVPRAEIPQRRIGILLPVQCEECGSGYYDKDVTTGRWE